jgi:hypothetical protein
MTRQEAPLVVGTDPQQVTRRSLFVTVAKSPRLLLLSFAGVVVASSVAYAVVEDATLINAVYWSLVTATTLGDGDFAPHSTAGKVLTSVPGLFDGLHLHSDHYGQRGHQADREPRRLHR